MRPEKKNGMGALSEPGASKGLKRLHLERREDHTRVCNAIVCWGSRSS